MKAKLDKEFVVKNRFWIMLGLVPLLWLIAFLTLSTSVASERDSKEKTYQETVKKVSAVGNVKSEEYLKPLRAVENKLKDHKFKVWADVWKSQEGIMFWPSSSNAPMASLSREPVRFGDDIPNGWRRLYGRGGLYMGQFKEFEQPPKPVLYYGGWQAILRPVDWKRPPTVEECWLAQERLWVQKELLKMVEDTLNSVARFEDVTNFRVNEHRYVGQDITKEGSTLGPGVIARQVSSNPSWELDLILQQKDRKDLNKKEPAEKDAADPKPDEGTPAVGDTPPEGDKLAAEKKEPPVLVLSPQSKLRNINGEKASLRLDGLKFRLTQRDAKGNQTAGPVELNVAGPEPLAHDAAIDITDKPVVLERFNYRERIQIQLMEDKSDPMPKGYLARQRLRNPNWELELLVERGEVGGQKGLIISGKSKIKNVHPHQRTLSLNGVQFKITQGENAPATLKVESDTLAWGQAPIEIRTPVLLRGFNERQPLAAEQVLEWATSPIRRIDEIRVGYPSHRTAEDELKAKTFGPADAQIQPPTPEPFPGEGVDPSLAEGGGFPRGEEGFLPGGGGLIPGQSMNLTPNGIDRNRYYDLTDQVRRIPLGMVLVVDQAHIQDVLTAFSNSRLRIQPSQIHYRQIRGVYPYNPEQYPEGTFPPGEGGDRPLPAPGSRPSFRQSPIGAFPRGEGDQPAFGPRPFGGGPAFPPGGGIRGIPGGGVTGEGVPGEYPPAGAGDDPNLVQLSIYGIASLYERWPPRASTPASPTPEQQPGGGG